MARSPRASSSSGTATVPRQAVGPQAHESGPVSVAQPVLPTPSGHLLPTSAGPASAPASAAARRSVNDTNQTASAPSLSNSLKSSRHMWGCHFPLISSSFHYS